MLEGAPAFGFAGAPNTGAIPGAIWVRTVGIATGMTEVAFNGLLDPHASHFLFTLDSIVATGAATLQAQIGYGGFYYATSGYYAMIDGRTSGAAAITSANNNNVAQWVLTSNVTFGTTGALTGMLWVRLVRTPSPVDRRIKIQGWVQSSTTPAYDMIHGDQIDAIPNTGAMNSFRFFTSANAFDRGEISLYAFNRPV